MHRRPEPIGSRHSPALILGVALFSFLSPPASAQDGDRFRRHSVDRGFGVRVSKPHLEGELCLPGRSLQNCDQT